MNNKQLFEFYEKVRVTSDNLDLADINGLLAAVIGRVQNEDGSWTYAVHVYDRRTSYSVADCDLTSTGEHAERTDFYSGESLRVSRDGNTTG